MRLASAARDRAAAEALFDEEVVTAEMLDAITQAAPLLKVENPLPAKTWKAMATRFRDQGALTLEDTKAIRRFALEARRLHRALHAELRASDYKDEEVNRALEDVHLFLHAFETPRQAHRETSTRLALEAISGAGLGALGVVTAYAAWSDQTQSELKELAQEVNRLEQGEAPYLVGGNRVRAVHQEKLWQTKMELLDEAIESARAGRPVEIDAQYFELTSSAFVGKLAEAARAGCPLRINIDPSRPRPGGLSTVSVDDGPRKLRAMLQLAGLPDADVGVSVFPIVKELGHLSELMHRKLLRVGEKVLLGGMNANQGSGENIDCGYLLEGPVTRSLTRCFQRDVATSAGATFNDVYGTDKGWIEEEELVLTPHGILNLLDIAGGPSPAGHSLPKEPTYDHLQEIASRLGHQLHDLVALSPKNGDAELRKACARRRAMPLSSKGKELLYAGLTRAFQQLNSAGNLERLNRMELPEGKPAGETVVAVGDLPTERSALMLHAISTAEEFVFIPTFVITKPVARALAARKAELQAQGKDLDVRVLVDPGIYPYGGTPNEHGVLALEDAGIEPRWALLPRTNDEHDRKIHAKQILTDKMEFFGSTNLSSKGMQDNWELSGVVFFDPADPSSMEAREDGRARFLKLWEHESISFDSRVAAEKLLQEEKGRPDYEMRVEEARRSAIRGMLWRIQQFETESASWVQQQAQSPVVAARIQQLELAGMAPGYAALRALEDELGARAFYSALKALPAYTQLQNAI